MESKNELIQQVHPNFNGADTQALLAYDQFMDEYHLKISDRLRAELADHPVLGLIIKSQTPEEQLEQDRNSRRVQKEAILEGNWDAYSSQLLEQGIAYANMGLEFSHWSYMVKIYRDFAQPMVVHKYRDNLQSFSLVLSGLNKIIDYALNVIAESYFIEKNKLIRKEQEKKEQAMKELKESEERFRALFQNSMDHIFMIDEKGIIQFINHVAIGLRKDDVIGSCLYDYQTDATREKVKNAVGSVFRTGQPVTYEHEATVAGSIRYYISSVAPVFYGETVKSVAVISRDETERIMANKRIQELNQTLEQKIEDRTRELITINEELEGFSYTVSHDLRAPIRGIDGFTKVLASRLSGKLSQQEQHYLDMIIENSRRMGKLIDDLLSFSRMGRIEKQPCNFDMEQLVRQVFDEQVQGLDPSRVQFSIEPLVSCRADRELIKVVWGNLIGNALKYSSTRDLAIIKVSCQEKEAEVIYKIEDNGVGFEVEFVHKIFGIFQRLHDEEEFEGTGVGLAIVHRIIHRHNGEVWAESRLGESATFCFSLPK